jgi:cyclophilin family peptidyl-prolyl cis-trans isomerase
MSKLFCILMIIGIFGFAFADDAMKTDSTKKEIMKEKPMDKAKTSANPLVEMTIAHGDTELGKVTIEVYEKEVPIHAANFLKLVDEGYYNGLTFHRVVPNFVIQGGDPTGTGTGGPPGRLQDDPSSPYTHERGTIAMARSGAGASKSQFYINLKQNFFLDKQGFLIFANVVDGMDVVDKVAAVETGAGDKPVVAVTMTKVERKSANKQDEKAKSE